MSEIIIIPARYNSTRLPGKLLIEISGISILQRTWLQCIKVLSPNLVYVATDDERIVKHCYKNKMNYILTSKDHKTGTDRISEAYQSLHKKYKTIVNVQGDEPFVNPNDIREIIRKHQQLPGYVCCGMTKIKSEEEFRNPNIIKVVTNMQNELLYMSRAPIPTNKSLGFETAYKQVCIYAFNNESITEFSCFEKNSLEKIEDIELLRCIDLGYKVKMIETSNWSMSIDTIEDVEKSKKILKMEN